MMNIPQVVKEQTQTTVLEFIAYINALNIFFGKNKIYQ